MNPIADMLTKIKNAYQVGRSDLEVGYSSFKEAIAQVLEKEGYLKKVAVAQKNGQKILKITLLYKEKKPALEGVKTISRSSLRVYVKKGKTKKVLGGTGISILSTPQGLMTDEEARKKNLGGELICEVW